MSSLMKKSNPFRPKTTFESFMSIVGNRKQLSVVYKILVKNVNMVEKAKLQWENELGTMWTEIEKK